LVDVILLWIVSSSCATLNLTSQEWCATLWSN
jgi:hypothetical protein